VEPDIAKHSNGFIKLFLSIGLPSWIGNAAVVLARGVRRSVMGLKHRRELSRLTDLDDHMLADIGLRRGDLHQASCEPFWRDPMSVWSGAPANGGRHAIPRVEIDSRSRSD
jgi:uncharacterized protein YjiS (DUF1127 family)